MSSHHIVREKQEPALIIANGEACSDELLGQLLEWSPFVVVLDGALERVLARDIKIDIILGDFDEVNVEELRKSQYPVRVVHTPDQNYTDLEKVITFLIQEGFPAANIIWATGRRMDHTLSNISLLPKFLGKINLKILDDYSVIFPLQPLPYKFSKWYKKGTVISLLPYGYAQGITTANLVYPLTEEDLQLGVRNGNSNEVAEDGEIAVSFHSGNLLLIELMPGSEDSFSLRL